MAETLSAELAPDAGEEVQTIWWTVEHALRTMGHALVVKLYAPAPRVCFCPHRAQKVYSMNIVKALTVGTFLASTLIATGAVAKGHNNGFGGGAKGTLSGDVDDGQSNNVGSTFGANSPETAYGIRDTLVAVEAGEQDNSDAARIKDAAHPSSTPGQ
jgi:hypothetical protein